MPNSFALRLPAAAALLAVLAACSNHSAQPALSDDLKQDLATVGGSDVQLAGAASPRLEVVSAAERPMGNVPTPKAHTVARVASTHSGHTAVVKSARHVTPVMAQSPAPTEEAPVPAAAPEVAPPAPEPTPAAMGRPDEPRPSRQREPRGGWSTPGQVIRNAPFPINP